MSTTLENKLNAIYEEKASKIRPENIKKGITIFGIEGTVEAGELRKYNSIEELKEDERNNLPVGLYGIIYNDSKNAITSLDMLKNEKIMKLYIPETIIIENYDGSDCTDSFTYDSSALGYNLEQNNISVNGYNININISYMDYGTWMSYTICNANYGLSSQDGTTYTYTLNDLSGEKVKDNIVDLCGVILTGLVSGEWKEPYGSVIFKVHNDLLGFYQTSMQGDKSVITLLNFSNCNWESQMSSDGMSQTYNWVWTGDYDDTKYITKIDTNKLCTIFNAMLQDSNLKLMHSDNVNVSIVQRGNKLYMMASNSEAPYNLYESYTNYAYPFTENDTQVFYNCAQIYNSTSVQLIELDIDNETYSLVSDRVNIDEATDWSGNMLKVDGMVTVNIKYDSYEDYQNKVEITPNMLTGNINVAGYYGNPNIKPEAYGNLQKSMYSACSTQLTLTNPNQLMEGYSAFGNNGVVTGDGSIYDSLDRQKMIQDYFGIDINNYDYDYKIIGASGKAKQNNPRGVSYFSKVENGNCAFLKLLEIKDKSNLNIPNNCTIYHSEDGSRFAAMSTSDVKIYDNVTNELLKTFTLAGSNRQCIAGAGGYTHTSDELFYSSYPTDYDSDASTRPITVHKINLMDLTDTIIYSKSSSYKNKGCQIAVNDKYVAIVTGINNYQSSSTSSFELLLYDRETGTITTCDSRNINGYDSLNSDVTSGLILFDDKIEFRYQAWYTSGNYYDGVYNIASKTVSALSYSIGNYTASTVRTYDFLPEGYGIKGSKYVIKLSDSQTNIGTLTYNLYEDELDNMLNFGTLSTGSDSVELDNGDYAYYKYIKLTKNDGFSINENGELVQPSTALIDKMYTDYSFMVDEKTYFLNSKQTIRKITDDYIELESEYYNSYSIIYRIYLNYEISSAPTDNSIVGLPIQITTSNGSMYDIMHIFGNVMLDVTPTEYTQALDTAKDVLGKEETE